MSNIIALASASLALVASGPAAAERAAPSRTARVSQEARIPFLGPRTIRSYHSVGFDTVYLQDQRRNWYRATLFGPCLNLGRSVRIGVDTRFGNALDSTSSLIVGGERCRIQSLVHSEGPPSRRRGR